MRSVIRTYIKTGRIVSIKKRAPKLKKVTTDIENFIKVKIAEDVSISLRALKNLILLGKNVDLSKSAIDRALQVFNYSFKRVVLVPECRNSVDNMEKRYIYANIYLLLNEEKTIFVDEMGVSCSLR